MIRIVTQLSKDAVLTALRGLAPKDHDARIFSLKSVFEGQIDPQRVVVGYRFNAAFPSFRLVIFSGQVHETDAGTKIHGNITNGWVIYAIAAWFVAVPPLVIVGSIADGNFDFLSALWGLAICVGLFLLGRVFVRATQGYVVAEIGRAVRGKVTQD